MKNFSYLHVSGFAAMGLIVACMAQYWFGEHRPTGHTVAYKPSADTIRAAEEEHRQAAARLAMLREDRKLEELARAQTHRERTSRELAWQAYYKQPEACQHPTTQVLFTACADEHIRARKEFEHSYQGNKAALVPFQSTIATNEE